MNRAAPHPERLVFAARLADRLSDLLVSYSGDVFRFVDPRFTRPKDLFAGTGSVHADGRWMLQGTGHTVYTSLLPETAMAEALATTRYYGFPDKRSTPLVFVSASAKLKKVIDLSSGRIRQRLRFSEAAIVKTDWRRENRKGREAVTQAWGWALHAAGVEGVLCSSAAQSGGQNLIVFRDNLLSASRLEVVEEVTWPRG